jgi:DNA-binding NtrC family response regulator
LRGQVRIAAATRQHIVILGQKGSGSEWVARSIHESSKGAEDPEEPCLVIDTPLMDAELLEVTLSPALAHLGVPGNRAVTCVLKGVDEAPAEIQERVIDFAKRSPGSVRLIGLCHLPILDGLRAGTITPSMSSALSVFEVRIEPLATRPEDIPLIASALLDQRRESERIAAERIGREAMDLLVLFPWPENFEELDAALRHASQVCRGPVIAPEHLPLAIRTYRPRAPRSRPIVSERLDVAMANYELGLIQEAMELCSGNRSEAARRLGISRTRLIRRLEGIDRDSRGRGGS